MLGMADCRDGVGRTMGFSSHGGSLDGRKMEVAVFSGEIGGQDPWAVALAAWMATGKWEFGGGGCDGEGENPW